MTTGRSESFRTDTSLKASVRDGMCASVAIGVGEGYLSPFAIFLGATSTQAGVISTLPQFIGALCQLAGLGLMSFVRSRRRIVLAAVVIQAWLWGPIALIPWTMGSGPSAVTLLVLFTILYFASASVVGPVWNSWIGDLVPAHERGRFFGHRNRQTGLTTILTLGYAALVLKGASVADRPALGFQVLFVTACAARLLSAYFLLRHADPPFETKKDDYFSFVQFVKRAPHSNFTKFVFFVATFNFAVNFAAPYFAVYVLNDLGFDYVRFTAFSAVTIFIQFLVVQLWGRVSDDFGNKKILNVCSFGLAAAPFLWLVSSSFWWIFVVQLYTGFFWAGFNLATANFMFDAVTPSKRARCVTYQSIISAVFVFAGAMAGSFVAGILPAGLPLGSGLVTVESPLIRIFFISGVLRVAVLAVFLPKFKEVREVEVVRHRDLLFRIAHVRPLAGATVAVVDGVPAVAQASSAPSVSPAPASPAGASALDAQKVAT